MFLALILPKMIFNRELPEPSRKGWIPITYEGYIYSWCFYIIHPHDKWSKLGISCKNPLVVLYKYFVGSRKSFKVRYGRHFQISVRHSGAIKLHRAVFIYVCPATARHIFMTNSRCYFLRSCAMHFTHILLSGSVYKHEKLNPVTLLRACSSCIKFLERK